MIRPRSIAILAALAAAVLASPAGAVTYFTIDGHTSGTVTTPGALLLRADTASPGNLLRLIVVADSNQNGVPDAGEQVVANEPIRDGAYNDEDAAASTVQWTVFLRERMSAHFAIRILDQNGTFVDHAFDFVAAAQPQSISGSVRDQNGSPIAGAMINVNPFSGDLTEHMAVTDSSGSFSLSLPAGRYEISPWHAGRAVPGIYRVKLQASQSVSGLNFVVDSSALTNSISGTVLGPGSQPVPGTLLVAADSYEMTMFTDINGDYTARVSAGGWVVLPVDIPQGYSYSGSGELVTVPPNQSNIDLTLSAATSYCYGTITDSLGSPVPGADVAGEASFLYFETSGNQYGKYVLFLPSGTWDISALAPGYSIHTSSIPSVTVPPNTQVDLTLNPNTVTVSGQVTEAGSGSPARFALVTAQSSAWSGDWDTRADSSGNYTLHLPPGSYQVCAFSELLGSAACSGAVDATHDVTGLNLTLSLINHSPALSGGQVSPQSGPAGTTFTFQVAYSDSDNDPPEQVYVVIDGWPREIYPVNPGDTNYVDGADYSLDVSGLSAGSHSFWFGALESSVFSNRWGYDLRLPASGSYPGPDVGGTGDPSVSITSPVNGATVKGTVTVTATASDPDGIQKVEFYDGAVLKHTDSAAPYEWAWNTADLSVAEGLHDISAKAYDNAAHTAQAGIQVTVDNATFDDVPKTSSQWSYIEALVARGITSGCSVTPPLYCPTASITRAQMAVFIIRAMGQTPYANPTPTFEDVPSGHWAYGYIERMNQLHITTGCSTDPPLYCPNSPVTRAQMAVFLCRAAGKAGLANPTPTFADVPLSHWAYGYIERMADPDSWGGSPVTSGCATTPQRLYCPNSPNTRGQMAVFIIRAFPVI